MTIYASHLFSIGWNISGEEREDAQDTAVVRGDLVALERLWPSADCELPGYSRWSALWDAIQYGHCDIARHLLSEDRGGPLSIESHGLLVSHAVAQGNVEMVELFLRSGPIDINSLDSIRKRVGGEHSERIHALLDSAQTVRTLLVGDRIDPSRMYISPADPNLYFTYCD